MSESNFKNLQNQLLNKKDKVEKDMQMKPSLSSNLARSAIGQGLLFGFGDELEAGVRAAFDKSRTYDDFVNDIRTNLQQFREDSPGLAYGSEIVGSIPAALTGAGALAKVGIKGVGKVAALEGATYGAGASDGDATERVYGAGAGAAISGPVAKLGSRVLPKITEKAKKIQDKGIRLTLGQQVGGEGGTIFGSLLENVEKMSTSIPAVGAPVAQRRIQAIVDFNRVALNEAVEPINLKIPKDLSPREAFEFVDDQISKSYDEILGKLSISDANALENKILKTIVDSDLDETTQNVLLKQMQKKIFSKIKNGKLDGKTIKNLETELGRLERSYKPKGGFEGEVGIEYGKIKTVLLNELADQNNGAVELQKINRAYGNLIPIKEAMASAIAKEGVFTPAQLLRGIRKTDKSKYKTQSSKGNRPLQDTADLASEIVGNAFPDSGTASRLITGDIVTDFTQAAPYILPGLLSGAMYSSVGRPITNTIIRTPEFITRTTSPAVSSMVTPESQEAQDRLRYLNSLLK